MSDWGGLVKAKEPMWRKSRKNGGIEMISEAG
jgi:hypothetical protein